MSLVSSVNHVAIVTDDLDRFISFYTQTLGLELVFREEAPTMRHAILRSGTNSWLHPVESRGNDHGRARGAMLARGHIDHIALQAESPQAFYELRRRLVACGASEGAVEDLGAFHALWFTDPDDMRVELSLIVDHRLRRFHAPVHRQIPTPAGPSAVIESWNGSEATRVAGALFEEYLSWTLDEMDARCGIRFADREVTTRGIHRALEAELLEAKDSVVWVAHVSGEAAGVVVLKPVSREVAEVKRLYVRPCARGHALARKLMTSLLDEARAQGCARVELETATFMTQAHRLYRSLGFVDMPPFDQAESGKAGVTGATIFFGLTLS